MTNCYWLGSTPYHHDCPPRLERLGDRVRQMCLRCPRRLLAGSLSRQISCDSSTRFHIAGPIWREGSLAITHIDRRALIGNKRVVCLGFFFVFFSWWKIRTSQKNKTIPSTTSPIVGQHWPGTIVGGSGPYFRIEAAGFAVKVNGAENRPSWLAATEQG